MKIGNTFFTLEQSLTDLQTLSVYHLGTYKDINSSSIILLYEGKLPLNNIFSRCRIEKKYAK